jgi:hypothetical protein
MAHSAVKPQIGMRIMPTTPTTTENIVDAGFVKLCNGDHVRASDIQRVVALTSDSCKVFIRGRKYSAAANRSSKELFKILAAR